MIGVLFVAVPAAVYLVAILIADSSPSISLWIYALVPVVYLLGAFLGRRTLPPGWEPES